MADAILLFGDSLRHPNILWRTRFSAPDAVVYIESGDHRILMVDGLEYGRAQKQAAVTEVRRSDSADWRRRFEAGGEFDAHAAGIAGVLAELAAERVLVEADFPLALARALEQHDVVVEVSTDLFRTERRRKSPEEQEAIAQTQAAAVASMEAARAMLREAEIREGKLWYGGEPLTSDRVIATIEQELLRLNCVTDSTIVSAGPGAADPHVTNTGHLDANTGVIIDIFPVHKGTHYYGDVTRTFVVGEPSQTWLTMYEAVRSAHQQALAMLRDGVSGREVHLAVCEALFAAGFATTTDGFTRDGGPVMNHGTGHGVGLMVHEAPRINRFDNTLRTGDVVTIEPGLYSETEGSVRLENTVVITADGYRELTHVDTDWRP